MLAEVFVAIERLFFLPPALLMAICSGESDFRNVINPLDRGSPSFGVCQLKLGTAKMLGFSGPPERLMNRVTNIYYAGKYLRRQLNRYKWDVCKAVSAYNMGKAKYTSSGRIKNPTYIRRVFDRWRKYGKFSARREGIKRNKRYSRADLERFAKAPMSRTNIVRCLEAVSKR